MVTVLDSDGQMQSGVMNGNHHWIGEYEQCESVKATGLNISDTAKHDFDGRYCRAFYSADVSKALKGYSSQCGVHSINLHIIIYWLCLVSVHKDR